MDIDAHSSPTKKRPAAQTAKSVFSSFRSVMEQRLQRHIRPLQASQQLRRKHRQADGTDRQGEAQEDQAVFDRCGKQDDQGQEAEDRTGDLPEEYGTGEQRGTEPDQQRDHQRDRHDKDFQNGFHGAASFPLLHRHYISRVIFNKHTGLDLIP